MQVRVHVVLAKYFLNLSVSYNTGRRAVDSFVDVHVESIGSCIIP